MEIKIDANTVGVALLVSNDYKGIVNVAELEFVHQDSVKMEQMFKHRLSYTVYRKKNVTGYDFVSYYEKLAKHSYPSMCKRILVYFSGHGSSDRDLLMQDKTEVKIADMIDCFKKSTCSKESAGMVKMFFFDICRGSRQDLGYKGGDETKWRISIPKEGGMLFAYASTPDHVAYGNSSGSRWTNCLVQALEKSKDDDDALHVLTSANILMRKEVEKKDQTPGAAVEFQTAEYISTLAEFVYFKQEAVKK